MLPKLPYQLLANAVLTLHFAIVLFVVGGLVLIVVGNVRAWSWVNSLWFRSAHLFAIAVVVAESWFDIACPLTTLEAWLNSIAGSAIYRESFIEHWLQRLLFYEAPSWVFAVGYSAFGLLVLLAWWYFPPKRNGPHHENGA